MIEPAPTRYLLDTNVVSETRRRRAEQLVLTFLSSTSEAALYLSVLTLGELRRSCAAKRRTDPDTADELAVWVDGIESNYADRILDIDAAVARRWGELTAARSLPVVDALLAATALVNGLTVATRNVRDFAAMDVPLIDPWTAAQSI